MHLLTCCRYPVQDAAPNCRVRTEHKPAFRRVTADRVAGMVRDILRYTNTFLTEKKKDTGQNWAIIIDPTHGEIQLRNELSQNWLK